MGLRHQLRAIARWATKGWYHLQSGRTGGKPRVLFFIDKPGWAFDISARQIASRLSGAYEFEFKYLTDKPYLHPPRYDLIYLFFWGDRYYRPFGFERRQIIKQISSHRWEDDPAYGPCTPQEMAARYLQDAGVVTCTSLRLLHRFEGLHPHLYHTPNGVNPSFCMTGERHGPLRIGWAGNVNDPVKRFHELVEPACEGRFELLTAKGGVSHEEMNAFYNSVDVIVVSSRHEGEPLPLLEGMAAGCFPVCVDVGIVPELIRSGENGLILPEATPAAFRAAFEWCEAHLDEIREAGKRNVAEVEARSWEQVVPTFRRVLEEALALQQKE